MATLEENIAQAIADFDDIEAAIEEQGVEVPAGTDTSEYGNLIRGIQGGKADLYYDPESENAQSGLAVAEALATLPIKYVESPDGDGNTVYLRSLESGTYVLKGSFKPYEGSGNVCRFSSDLLVNIVKGTLSGVPTSHIQIFYPVHNVVQFVDVTDSTYNRTDIKLNDLAKLETVEEMIAAANTEAQNIYSNAIKANASGEVVRVDDVSPVEHYATAKVSGKNLFGFNGRTVLDFGGYDDTSQRTFVGNGIYTGVSASNYYDPLKCTYTYDKNNGQVQVTTEKAWYGVGIDVKVKPLTTYFVSGAIPDSCFVSASQYNANGKHISYQHCKNNTFTTGEETAWVLLVLSCQYTDTAFLFENIQIEEGDTATEYEPYIDPTTVTLTKYGKNLLPYPFSQTTKEMNGVTFTDNGDGTITVNGTPTENSSITLIGVNHKRMFLPAGKTFRLHGGATAKTADEFYVFLAYDNGTADTAGEITYVYDYGKTNGKAFIPVEGSYVYSAGIVVKAGNTFNNVVFKPQFEFGEDTTDYEQYTAETYTPAADGSCEVVSVAPTMTLLTDTEGVTIDVEYNQDANKAMQNVHSDLQELDKVTAELAAQIGDVSSAFDELHAYAQSLVTGGATE